jgi:hypothetical protein
MPEAPVEKYLKRLETEDLWNKHFAGVVAVVAARTDATLVARLVNRQAAVRCQSRRRFVDWTHGA